MTTPSPDDTVTARWYTDSTRAQRSVTGPDKIPCSEQCEVPEGVTLTPIPRPRHAWSDVLVCPNEGCGLCFLKEPPTPDESQRRLPASLSDSPSEGTDDCACSETSMRNCPVHQFPEGTE